MPEHEELEWKNWFYKQVFEFFQRDAPGVPDHVMSESAYELANKLFEAYEIKTRVDRDRVN